MSLAASLMRLACTPLPAPRLAVAGLLPRAGAKARFSRALKTAVVRSSAQDQQNVPVHQQQKQQQQPHQQQQGGSVANGGSTRMNGSMQRQAPPQQQRGLRSRRSAGLPSSLGLTPFADTALFAPGFGRMGGFLRSIEDEMDTMMQALNSGDSASVAASLAPELSDVMVPLHVDLVENEKDITIKADVPGMSKSDINVQVDPEGMLTISGERTVDHMEPGDANDSANSDKSAATAASGFRRIERKFGSFTRRFALPPQKVHLDNISAKVDKGVLTITVPKVDEAKEQPRRIDVQ